MLWLLLKLFGYFLIQIGWRGGLDHFTGSVDGLPMLLVFMVDGFWININGLSFLLGGGGVSADLSWIVSIMLYCVISLVDTQCLWRDRLVIPHVNKKWRHSRDRPTGQKWHHLGGANSSHMPPDNKVNKAKEVTYLSINNLENLHSYQICWSF